jgi:two-component system osmolarity sensor histidine kinase EnvZ
MKAFFQRPFGLFRKIWFWFLVLITLNQTAILISYYVFIVKPTAISLTTVFMGLADSIQRGQSSNELPNLDILKDHWASENHIAVISGVPGNLEPRPMYPAFAVIESKLRTEWGDRVQLGYTSMPDRTLWLLLPNEEKPFSIGIPFGDRVKTQMMMILIISLIFTLTIISAWIISARLGRPLQDLMVTTRKLGRGEDVDFMKSSETMPPEIAGLTQALKQMRTEIHQMQSERERFLAGIAHDLRTPLSRMRVAIEFPEIKNTSLANGLQEDIEEMRIILDHFLELSKLEAEKSEAFIEGDISDLIRTLGAKYLRAGDQISLKVQDVPPIRYKPIALTRLLYNLIDNALRHGSGIVFIDLKKNGSKVCISVRNRIDPQSKESSFMRTLWWLGGVNQSGLGTAIIRRLCDIHLANLIVDSDDSDEFSVSIEFEAIS